MSLALNIWAQNVRMQCKVSNDTASAKDDLNLCICACPNHCVHCDYLLVPGQAGCHFHRISLPGCGWLSYGIVDNEYVGWVVVVVVEKKGNNDDNQNQCPYWNVINQKSKIKILVSFGFNKQNVLTLMWCYFNVMFLRHRCQTCTENMAI